MTRFHAASPICLSSQPLGCGQNPLSPEETPSQHCDDPVWVEERLDDKACGSGVPASSTEVSKIFPP